MIQQFSRLELSSQDYLLSQIGDSQIPSQFHNSPQIEKIDNLVIQNFKSFDKKYVGPFLNFTCIIGPNGSGKSNILDALMFCFCSENSKHSLIDARELINRQGKQTFKDLSKLNKVCSVEATFILKNKEKFTICRTLDGQGKQQYLLNFKNVNKKVYQNVLIRKGINCIAPNYAIWQGQIDRLVLKQPTQLTSLLENLSGSIYYKKPYQQSKQKLKQIQTIIEDRTKRINKLKIDRKNLKVIKNTNNQYNKYDNQFQQIMKKIYYLEVLKKNRDIEELEEEVRKVEEQERKKILEINQLKNLAQKDYVKKLEFQKQMNKVMALLSEFHAKLKNIDNPSNILKLQSLKQAEQQVNLKQKQILQLKTKKQQIQNSLPQILPSALIEQYLSLYQQWQAQNLALHRQITKKKNQLLFVQGVLQGKFDILNQVQEKKKKKLEKRANKGKVLDGFRRDVESLGVSIKMMEAESAKISSQAQKFKTEYNKKHQSFQQLGSTIQQLQNLISQQAQDQKQAEILKTLSNIDGFHGVLHQKIKPNATKYITCFAMMVGGIGKYLLSQSEDSAKKIGNRLKQLKIMKNVIILDNVLEKNNSDLRKILGRDALMGIDVVEFDQDTRKLKQFLAEAFYGKVVCDNINTAYKIRNKNLEGVKEIYTLDGNVIRKDGVVTSHGSVQSMKKLQKFTTSKSTIFQQLSKLNKQKIKLESELQNIKLKFDEKELLKRNNEIIQMSRKKQVMIGKLKQLQNEEDKEVNVPQTIINQIKQLEKQKEKLNKNVVELEKMIKTSKIFDKFMKKHKIDNLDTFRNANNVEYAEKLMKKKNQSTKQLIQIEGMLQKTERQLHRKIQQLKILQQQVKSIPEKGDKSKIQSLISNKQKQLVDLRTKISKLSIINKNQMIFQSTLPSLQAKLVYAKQKISKDLENLSYELGVDYKYPIPQQQLISQLDLPRKITDRVLESISQKLQQQKNKIQQNLDKHNTINMLTTTNLQETSQKIQKNINTLLEDIQKAIEDRKKISEEFESVKKDRANVLLNFINILRNHLNLAYRALTQLQDGATGTVNLHVENQDQPFQHGVYYTPTPPTKRFVYDLEQLSGGQKSIASLALQYSISLASKSPILILDQTDAFLDTGNVSRLLKLINDSLRSHNMQIIVVTHKQGLFSKSESLVGVSRPKSLNLSQVYSLKLSDD